MFVVGDAPVIKSRDILTLSPWVTLVDRTVVDEYGHTKHFHSLRQSDYVTVFAETQTNEIVLVRQFRPALEAFTLEFPGGLHERGSDPVLTAASELEEETGFRARSSPRLLGCLAPDSGRLENRLWCYHTYDIEPLASWRPERGVERILLSKPEFLRAVRNGEFRMAQHIAVLGLVLLSSGASLP